VRSTRENRRFSKWKKVMDDFFHGQLGHLTRIGDGRQGIFRKTVMG
jgi:hypothetical protein